MHSIEEALPAFDVPALMVSATDDPAFSQDDARSLAALIPRVDGPNFVESGHYLQGTRRTRSSRTWTVFWRQISSCRQGKS